MVYRSAQCSSNSEGDWGTLLVRLCQWAMPRRVLVGEGKGTPGRRTARANTQRQDSAGVSAKAVEFDGWSMRQK